MSDKFKYFTPEQRYQANQVPIKELLDRLGEKTIKSGKEFRWIEHDSVTLKRNLWYQHSQQRGGLSVDFLITFFNYSYKEAIEFILNEFTDIHSSEQLNESVLFKIPKRNPSNQKVITYLIGFRFIDSYVIDEFINLQLLYEDERYHNCIFVGYDENNEIKHIHKRQSDDIKNAYRGNLNGSDASYSFHYNGISNSIYVFEAPIDLLSFITLHKEDWKLYHYVALCGLSISALEKQIELHPNINQVYLCLDHDIAGDEACDRIKYQLREHNLNIDVLKSICKDWNEDLKLFNNQPAKAGVDNPSKLLREEVVSKVKKKLESLSRISIKNLINDYSPFLYKHTSDNARVRIKSYDSLIDSAADALWLAKQQYKHLSQNYSHNEMIDLINNLNTYIDKPTSTHKIKGELVRKLNQIREIIYGSNYHLESEKLSLINHYMSFTNYCINTHVFFTLQERNNENGK